MYIKSDRARERKFMKSITAQQDPTLPPPDSFFIRQPGAYIEPLPKGTRRTNCLTIHV